MCVACGVLQLFPRLLLKVNQIGTVSESIDASLLHLPKLSCDVVQNSDLIVILGSQAVQDQWLGRYVPAPRHISRDSELASDLVLRCSHRSGETEDTTIADLAVGLCTGQKLDSKIDGRCAVVLSRSRPAKWPRAVNLPYLSGSRPVLHADPTGTPSILATY